MSFFKERNLPELEIGLLGNNKEKFLDAVKRHIENQETQIESNRNRFYDLLEEKKRVIRNIKSDPLHGLTTEEFEEGKTYTKVISNDGKEFYASRYVESLRDKIQYLEKMMEEKIEEIKKAVKDKNRALSRGIHADNNLRDLLQNHVYLEDYNGNKITVPYVFDEKIGEITIKNGKLVFLRSKSYFKSRFDNHVFINGQSISNQKSHTFRLRVSDKIVIAYDEDHIEQFIIKIDDLFESQVIEFDLSDLDD
jgi:hypothetical protein